MKPTIIRLILSLDLSHGWRLWQLEVNNVFLHGTLSKVVYIQQSLGFIDQNNPGFIRKLRKAIYGLKQAPRAWYTELKGFLLSYGFVNSRNDASLFIYHQNCITYYFLVYVDDLIVIGNCNKFLTCFLASSGTTLLYKGPWGSPLFSWHWPASNHLWTSPY